MTDSEVGMGVGTGVGMGVGTDVAIRVGRATAVDGVAASIREGVRQGRYVPGQRLVEADLTRELGVSRSSLREAFGRLASEGLIVIEPHRGARVRRLSRRDVADLFAVRAALESEAARLAANRIREPGQADWLRDVAEDLARVREGRMAEAYLTANARLHATLVEMAGNTLLAQLVDRLELPQFRAQFHDLLVRGDRTDPMLDHDEIVDAVLSGDAESAARAMRAHMTLVAEVTLSLPDQAFAPPPLTSRRSRD